MKRKALKNIMAITTKGLFLIALFPLIGLLGYGLCGAKFGYTVGITTRGFEGFKIYIENVLESELVYLCLALCCIYCLVYVISNMLYKAIRFKNVDKKSVSNKIFLISFIPYLMIFGAGLYSSKFRSRTV